MTYQEQLQSQEWKEKRKLILERDNFQCTNCGCKRTKFLGLTQKFGIKSYREMQAFGYSLGETLDENGRLFSMHNGSISSIPFVEDQETFSLENLKFAQKWVDRGTHSKFELAGYHLICFTTNVSETDKFPDLNIHHKYYIEDKKAWEYDNTALITLCHLCHKEEHKKNGIVVYEKFGNKIYTADICNRCDGSGYLPEYNYWQNGICFDCGGHGVKLKNN